MSGFKNLGIIAGTGMLPHVAAKAASERGLKVVTVTFFSDVFDLMEPCSDKIFKLGIGQVKKILKSFKGEGVTDLIMVGKIEKRILFESIKFDLKALSILRKMRNRNDDSVMLAVAEELNTNGIKVLPQTDFLGKLLVPEGLVTNKKLTSDENKDVKYGFDLAKKVAGLDIGQTIVVKNQSILAIEAIEGTCEAVKRGCLLCKGKSAVVVKVSKPQQDLRFDIPTVGMNTIKAMADHGGSILAIEADKTFVVDSEAVVKFAEKNKIKIIAV